MQRLDKILSEAGVASRKELKLIIKAGRVSVDGRIVRAPEEKVEDAAVIWMDGQPVEKRRRIVLMLHKPAGYVTSVEDPRDPTVMELLPEVYRKKELFPVGRLDKDTEGLLLLTNDGELAHRMISPRCCVEKVYEAEHEGEASEEDVSAFAEGLVLRDGTQCRPAVLKPLGPGKSRITLQEGKYHQVRRMMASRGLHVNYLKRVSEGQLHLDALACGACRELSEDELSALPV